MNALFIDGHNFLFKSYAVPFTFKSPKGLQLQVVSTFLALLRRAVRVTNADFVSVVFDSEVATDNHLLYSEYKANRNYDYSDVEMSPFDHIPTIKKALEMVNLTWVEHPGAEADDIIATFSAAFHRENRDSHSFIASTDTDFFQLLSEECNILKLLPQGAHEILTPESVVVKYNVTPQKYVELKAWVGDKADNIVGIPGIGWKRGAEIVNGTRNRELSSEEKKVFDRNVRLIRLNRDVPLAPVFSNPQVLVDTANNSIFEQCDF